MENESVLKIEMNDYGAFTMLKLDELNELRGNTITVSVILQRFHKNLESTNTHSKLLEKFKFEEEIRNKIVDIMKNQTDLNHPLTAAVTDDSNDTNMHMLYLYTDIIEPHMYANHTFSFLRCIPGCKNNKSGLHIVHEHLEFYPVSKQFIDTVSIVLTDSSGKTLIFEKIAHTQYMFSFYLKECK